MSNELDQYFEFKCHKGFDSLDLSGDEYKERLDYEIKCIKKMGFSGYLLIVQDLLAWAKRNDILCGPGRGSAAGSLVCYVLGITQVDPIKHGLLFERFLNPDRISMPDIDMDFEIDRRDEVVQYVKKLYGRNKVARITTFSEMQAKGALRDVSRALGLPYQDGNDLAKTITSGTIKENMSSNADLIALMKTPKLKETVELANRLEGNIRHSGIHAAGVVIGDISLNEYMPVYTSRKDENDNLTQFVMEDVEAVGLIKFDFLGLKNLSIVHMAQDMVRERHNIKVNLDDLTNTLDDPKVFELFANGDTTNIFQFESDGMKRYLRALKPTCFEEISAMNALYRPGPLDSGMLDDFIKRKNNPSEIKYCSESMVEHLKETYGVMPYQEQIMKLCQVVAGYTLSEADNVRKAIGKKVMSKLKKERSRFVSGCVKNGMSKTVAGELFDDIEKFGNYSFNKSHSCAYSIIAYWTAWFKVHYPLEYMTSVLSYEMNNKEDLFKCVSEARRVGIEFLPVDVNKSQAKFSIEGDAIRYALGAVEGVGVDTGEEIIKNRKKHGDYSSVRSVIELNDSRKATTQVNENLIKAGAFDFIGQDRSYMLASVGQMAAFKKKRMLREKKHQLLLFERVLDLNDMEPDEYRRPSQNEIDQYEAEALGFYLFDDPLKDYRNLIYAITTHSPGQIKRADVSIDCDDIKIAGYINSIKNVKRKRDGAPMAFIKLSDGIDEVDVCVFTAAYKKLGDMLKQNELIMFAGNFQSEGDGGKLIAQDASLLKEMPKLERSDKFFTFNLKDGNVIKLEARENTSYIPKVNKIFNEYKGGH